jgi:hypothetical protein
MSPTRAFYTRRWQELRDHLAGIRPTQFRMDGWLMRYTCGTIGCLAGHAAVLACGGEVEDDHWNTRIPVIAAKWLGLNSRDRDHVFLGAWTLTPIAKITRDEALAYLDLAIAARDPLVSIARRTSVPVDTVGLVRAAERCGLPAYEEVDVPATLAARDREIGDLAAATSDAVESIISLSPAARALLLAAWNGNDPMNGMSLDDAIEILAAWRDHVSAVAASANPLWDEARARETARRLGHTTARTCAVVTADRERELEPA